MQSISGFVTKSGFIDNTVDTISEFFELSPLALTYSRNRGEYQDALFNGDVLHTFRALDQTTGVPYVLPESQVQEILGVVDAVYGYLIGHAYPYDLEDMRATILAAYSGLINTLAFGNLHVGAVATFPDYLTWTSAQHDDTEVKIWLRNEAFENQYTYYEIVVVPPLDNLDLFFGNYGDVAAILNAQSVSDTNDRVQLAKVGKPETYTRWNTFPFINAANPAQSTPSRWVVLIYGKNGDNIDAVKDAIVDYVLANSSHNQAAWEVIFPEIFKRTEFRFYPRWDKIAIPNLTALSAIYSSVSDPIEALNYAVTKWPDVTPAWIEANLSLWPFDYKAITLLALNGESNVANKTDLKTLFSDYIPVSTSSPDFNRMTETTRNWVLSMVQLIQIAETATEFTSVASPFRRVVRDNVLYITLMYDEVNYLVAARSNLS